MLDMHSKVTIQEVLEVEIDSDDYVLFHVSYKVKRGRKIYKIWLTAEDFQNTGIFPLCYRRMTKYADVLDMHNNVIYTGGFSTCKRIVQSANKRYYQGESK